MCLNLNTNTMKIYLSLLFAGASIFYANGTNSDASSFETYRSRYTLFHKITLNHLESEFVRNYSFLENSKQTGVISDSAYREEMKEVLLNLNQLRTQIADEADYFARIDKQTLPSEEKAAFSLLENGKPAEALRAYQQIARLQLPEKKTEEIPYTIADSLIGAFERYAHLNTFTGGKENNAQAMHIYEAIAWSDTLNPQRMFPYAQKLYACKMNEEARIWGNRAVRNSSDPKAVAAGWILLGKIASALKEEEQINVCFDNALLQYDEYALQPDSSALYRSYYKSNFSIGSYYYNRKKYKQATPYFKKLIENDAILAENKTLPLYKPCLRTYLMLGTSYYRQKDIELANRIFEKGIRFIKDDRSRMEEEPDFYLSLFYGFQMYTNMWLGSEKVAQKRMEMALDVAIKLSQRTDSYYSHLAEISASKCKLYKNDTKLCIDFYEQIIDLILREGVYTPHTLVELNNYRKELATRYWNKGDKEKALALFGEMKNTYELFSIAFAKQLAPNYASFLQTYSSRLMDMEKYREVMETNRNALDIFLGIKDDPTLNVHIVNSALLLSKSLAKENQPDAAKEVLKQYESYIDLIPAKKEREQWGNAYEKAYKGLH